MTIENCVWYSLVQIQFMNKEKPKNLTAFVLYIARGRSRMHLADVKIHKNPQTINLKMTRNREKAPRQ